MAARIFLYLSTLQAQFPPSCFREIPELQMPLRDGKMRVAKWISSAVGNFKDVYAGPRKPPMNPGSCLGEISHPSHPDTTQEPPRRSDTVYCCNVSAWVTESRQGRLNYKKESFQDTLIPSFFFVLTGTHTHTQKCESSLIWGSQNDYGWDFLIPLGSILEFQKFLAEILFCWEQCSKEVESEGSRDICLPSSPAPTPQRLGGPG